MARSVDVSPQASHDFMTNRCVRCWKDFEADYKANVCDGCTSVVPGLPTFKPGLGDIRILNKGTSYESRIKIAEVNEIKRGVAIPTGNGKFSQGRRMENGKIAEKHIGC